MMMMMMMELPPRITMNGLCKLLSAAGHFYVCSLICRGLPATATQEYLALTRAGHPFVPKYGQFSDDERFINK